MKEFTTEPNTDRSKTVEFNLDGVILVARKPKSYAYVALTEANDSEDGVDTIKGTLQFLDDVLIPESRDHVQARLDDPNDDFDVEQVVEILNWVVEEFTARPTGRSSGSSPQPRRTGRPSTARARSAVSTPENSPSTDSSTP